MNKQYKINNLEKKMKKLATIFVLAIILTSTMGIANIVAAADPPPTTTGIDPVPPRPPLEP